MADNRKKQTKWTASNPATVRDISRLIGAHCNGNGSIQITGIAGIREAGKGDITFVADPKYMPLVSQTKASAVIIGNGVDIKESEQSPAFIRVDDPAAAFERVAAQFSADEMVFKPGIHPTAVIGEDVTLGSDIVIQAYAVICDGAAVGDRSIIYPHVYLGHYATIGNDCRIYSGVAIRERVAIGNNVIVHCNSVIGSDGYGYKTANGVHQKIPHVGSVEIEDDVEIGACVTIDRARFGKTRVGKGTKIDNLVMIAHNSSIGEHCLLVGQSGIAGSTHVGDHVVIAAQAGLVGHLEIGDRVTIGGKAGVTKNIPADTRVSGFPAQKHDKERREQVHLRKLPELCNRIKELGERLSQLEEAAKNSGK